MHPFTIAAMEPLDTPSATPGATLMASLEGSYGTFPNPAEYDKIVLVAGGSDASFTVGTALDPLKQLTRNPTQSIVFVWNLKNHDG
ncbi:hypothetical protein ColLi_10912 [Colletotrichum liriopes]|uniref:Uncharacterized protein n=1 Tax=Colletotrichum liriopes TaxID=708192 RepID=A0AA37LXA3_9PEZI|nr:hypothetical protein ColLi_10912 [Colletotrichum liriopes]